MDYTWDLTKIFKDEKEYKDTIEKVKGLTGEIIKYKGRILDSSNSLLELLTLNDKISLLIEKLYVFSYLGHYDNMADKKFQEYKEEISALCNEVESVTSFIDPELLSSDYEKVLKFIEENPKLEKYAISLERTFRYKPYVLSEKEEKLLTDASEIMRISRNAYDAIDNIDIKFDKIKDEKGKLVELTSSNFSVYLSSKNRNVRKNTFKKLYKYYKEHINTISALYIGKVKTNSFIAKTRGYNSILDLYLFGDKIDPKLYENLIKITNDNTKYLQKYYKVKESILGSKLHMYDTYVNISNVPEKVIEYEEAIEILNSALKYLGSEYLEEFNKLLNTRSVDVNPKKNKRSGAYEWGCYGVDPYVSLNYEKNSDSVSTLAHEMGHAMHTYYSNTNQDYNYASYPIFLAEIASTVNEVLLSNYLIENTDDIDEKIYHIVDFLDKFKATVYRQVMFAEFEDTIHKMYENGESLTKDLLCDTYYELNKKQFAPAIIVDEDIKYEWARIPHFYTSFYVYKYATGFISALVIADKLVNENGFKEKYIKFLSSGSSKYPLDLLKDLGIDLTDPTVLDRAFKIFNGKVLLLKALEREKNGNEKRLL